MKTIERIFMIMKEKNIKDKAIYTAARVPKSTFSTWKNTLKNPDPDTLPEIATILNVSLEYLITGKESVTPSLPTIQEDRQRLLDFYDQCCSEGQSRIMEQAEFIAQKYPRQEENLSKYKIG